MFRGYYQCTAVYIAGFIGMFVVLPRGVSAAARFTQNPPSKLYVTKGETARFVWDYQLDGGTTLGTMSPEWYFYQTTAHRIGSQVTNSSGKTWRLDTANCPSRLQSPTVRVSQEPKATLVITNVTTADNGLYACWLILPASQSPVISKVHLIITVVPPGRPNMTVTDIKASSATIRWTRLVNNGGIPILDYKLQIITTKHTNASVVHKSISGLENGTEYEVKLFARNVVGYGSAASKLFKTTEEDPTESTSSDTQHCYDTKALAALSTVFGLSVLFNILILMCVCYNC